MEWQIVGVWIVVAAAIAAFVLHERRVRARAEAARDEPSSLASKYRYVAPPETPPVQTLTPRRAGEQAAAVNRLIEELRRTA